MLKFEIYSNNMHRMVEFFAVIENVLSEKVRHCIDEKKTE